MSAFPKTRFLILNRTNEAMVPRDVGYPTDDVQAVYSPSFTAKDKAQKFGTFLADGAPGERFYLAEITAVACTPVGTVWLDTVPAPAATGTDANDGELPAE